MPGYKINEDGDYEIVNGNYVRDETYVSDVLFRLKNIIGSSSAYPLQGSRLFKIKKLTPESTQDAEQEALESLRNLIDQKKISNVVVKATIHGGDRMIVEVSFRDLQGVEFNVNTRLI